jgi:hypothetical protein
MIAVRELRIDIVKYLCTQVVRPYGTLDIDYESSRTGFTAFAFAVILD